MFTSNYRNLKKITPGMTAVRISRTAPRWLKGGWMAHLPAGVQSRDYLDLAPAAASLKMDEDAYHDHFAAILHRLDPAKVFADLGPNAVLLCFEPHGEMCHRRLVAEWFEANLGVTVPELGFGRTGTPNFVTPAYDWHPFGRMGVTA